MLHGKALTYTAFFFTSWTNEGHSLSDIWHGNVKVALRRSKRRKLSHGRCCDRSLGSQVRIRREQGIQRHYRPLSRQ
jgi:hypothetical protein